MVSREPIHLNVGPTDKKAGLRRGTRIPCEIPITLNALDPSQPFSGACLVIRVNPRDVLRGSVVLWKLDELCAWRDFLLAGKSLRGW